MVPRDERRGPATGGFDGRQVGRGVADARAVPPLPRALHRPPGAHPAARGDQRVRAAGLRPRRLDRPAPPGPRLRRAPAPRLPRRAAPRGRDDVQLREQPAGAPARGRARPRRHPDVRLFAPRTAPRPRGVRPRLLPLPGRDRRHHQRQRHGHRHQPPHRPRRLEPAHRGGPPLVALPRLPQRLALAAHQRRRRLRDAAVAGAEPDGQRRQRHPDDDHPRVPRGGADRRPRVDVPLRAPHRAAPHRAVPRRPHHRPADGLRLRPRARHGHGLVHERRRRGPERRLRLRRRPRALHARQLPQQRPDGVQSPGQCPARGRPAPRQPLADAGRLGPVLVGAGGRALPR